MIINNIKQCFYINYILLDSDSLTNDSISQIKSFSYIIQNQRVFYTQSVMLRPRFIPRVRVLYQDGPLWSVVRSSCFILTGSPTSELFIRSMFVVSTRSNIVFSRVGSSTI